MVQRKPPKVSGLLRSGAVVASDSPYAQPDVSTPTRPDAAPSPVRFGAEVIAPENKADDSTSSVPEMNLSDGEEVMLPIDLIDVSPFQPRIKIDEQAISALGLSIASEGQINAIIVRPMNGRYELVGGEHRWLAMQSIGKTEIRAVIRELSDEQAALMSLADNEARKDLCDYERAVSYKALLDKKLVKNAAHLSRVVGKTEMEISRCLAFHKLPDDVIPLLKECPDFLSARAAGEFAKYVLAGDDDLTMLAIRKVFDGKFDVLSALNWLKSESRARHSPSAPAAKKTLLVGDRFMGEMRVEGRKVVITCAAGVTPADLINTLTLNTSNKV